MATKESIEKAFDEAYECHNIVAENAKKEYDAVAVKMIKNLSAEQLKPFADILLENDEFEFNADETMESIKSLLLEEHNSYWNDMWDGNIANGIKRLEMLKEHFKKFEGTDWNIQEKTAEQRLLPIRVHYKKKRLNWLQKQVDHQSKLLKVKCKDATERRLIMKCVLDQDLQLTQQINNINFSDEIEELKKEFEDLLYFRD